MLNRLRRIPTTLIFGLVMMLILVILAVVAPILWGAAATELTGSVRQPPGSQHLLGTDQLGRDILARSLVATRLTLLMAAAATVIQVVLGVFIGGAVWVGPRRLREFVLRIVDASVAFPALVLALVVAAVLGAGSFSAVVAIGVAGIPSFARLTSNMVATVAQRDFVVTSRLLGVGGFKLLTRHLLPNISGPLLVLVTSSFALALLEIASLSFVGLGVQNPEFDYGLLLNDGLSAIYTQPWQAIAPSIMLIYAGIAAMLIGDGLATLADPGLRRVKRVKATGGAAVPSPSRTNLLVEVDDLHVFAPSGAELVKGVSFGIEPGQILGLVGESGSGKSMTAMALSGLLADGVTAKAARLRLDDLDLMGRNPRRRLATDIGLVYQDPGTTFNPALRMGYQLAEVGRVHLGMSRVAARHAAMEGLDRVRVRDARLRISQHPFQWSGGMLQRAAISGAISTSPKLLIADEPTTALDVTVQAEVLRQLRRINREQGTAMLFISHDIGVVQALCDVVMVMRDGVVIEEVSSADLAEGNVSHPYTRQLLAASPRMDDDISVLPGGMESISQEAVGHGN